MSGSWSGTIDRLNRSFAMRTRAGGVRSISLDSLEVHRWPRKSIFSGINEVDGRTPACTRTFGIALERPGGGTVLGSLVLGGPNGSIVGGWAPGALRRGGLLFDFS